jgi:peroxidase
MQTADGFDNAYYQNLVGQHGLLPSDQVLFNGGLRYNTTPARFSNNFPAAMVKLGNLLPAAGTRTEIRLNCRKSN